MTADRAHELDDDATALDQRLDKWLWFARVLKTRTQATKLVSDGKVRINRSRTDKPSHTLKPGDVVTVTLRGHVRVLKVLAPGLRRGPASEAQTLFEEIADTRNPDTASAQSGLTGEDDGLAVAATPAPAARRIRGGAVRERGSGRPTKRDRRLTDKLRDENN